MSTIVEERVQQLPVANVLPSPKNPRGPDVGDVAELAESIKAQGIVEPLIVSPDGKRGGFVVVAGHRRLAAAKLAGLKTVPGLVRQLGEREQLITMLVENLQRRDLAPLQEASGYQQLAELEYSQREIARQVGKSQSHIAKRLALLKLSAPARSTFESGGISAEDAVVLAAQPPSTQARVLEETNYGSMASRIQQLENNDKWKAQREAEAKREAARRPQLAAEAKRAGDKMREAERAKEKLRREAQTARARILPRIISRGERELQYAAAAIAKQLQSDVARVACEILGIKATKPKRAYSSIDYRGALAKRAATSKAKAIEVLLALALGAGETHVRSPWAGQGGEGTEYIRMLVKAGYKPNPPDRRILKVRRR